METLTPASWKTRFWAWLIDVLLMSVLWYMGMTISGTSAISPRGLGFHAILLFLYWTFLEGYRGQSLGKMVLGIAVVGPVGERIGFKDSAVESFGKAFLLPLDLIVGILADQGRGQRLFNRLSNTIVAEAEEDALCALQL
ncbi:MAG: RDD family protein [Methanotrichaceae archaeon]|nr:RDD family protein [Methanotrichaceae archaeon]